jgi:hypothetical protein
MNTKTEEILTHDSLYESEKIFGNKHWSEFNEFEQAFSMFKFMEDNQRKEDHLKSINDTYFNMGWTEFKSLIKEHGFIPALEYDVKHDEYIDEFIIYYHTSKGLVICADSYFNKQDINGGNLYGEIQANSKEDEHTIWRWLSTGGCINSEKSIWTTQHDVREGLFSKLQTLESAGTFLPKWTKKDRFLWFVDYTENKVPGYDYEKITREKILRCPKELQDIIGINS